MYVNYCQILLIYTKLWFMVFKFCLADNISYLHARRADSLGLKKKITITYTSIILILGIRQVDFS